MAAMTNLHLPSLYADAPIRLKILSLSLFALILPACLSLILIRLNYRAVEAFSGDVALYAAINRLKAANEANTASLETFLRSGALEDLAVYNASVDDFVAALSEAERTESDLESRFLITSLWNSFNSRYEEAQTALRTRLQGQTDPYTAFFRAERIGRYMNGYISMLMDRTLVLGSSTYRGRLDRAAFVRSATIIALAATIILCVLLSFFLAGYITEPIRRLSAAAARIASGDLAVEPIALGAGDEVGALTGAFNAMNAHIAALVDDLKQKASIEAKLHAQELRNERDQKLLKESAFLSLQARIQPHFLFNTLNSISRDIMLRGGRDAGALIDALSALLRYALEQGNGLSSLEAEIEIVRQYAFIQKHRFHDRIAVAIDCRLKEPRSVKLPAFTLQPLVENAFIHGLEPKVAGGTISVVAERRAKTVAITVSDDGIGMDADQLRAVRRRHPASGDGPQPSIGLDNVRERLRLFTGDKRCFSIRSTPSVGTTTEIILREAGA